MFTPKGDGEADAACSAGFEIIDGKTLLCFPYVKLKFSSPVNIRNL